VNRKFPSLLALAEHFDRVAAAMPAAEHGMLEAIGGLVERDAKRRPGTYQSGWAPLKPETIARKATGDSPLLETGAHIRDTISHQVGGHKVEIGSPDIIAVYQTFGTSRGIPPRPFLAPAMIETRPQQKTIIADGIARTFRSTP
jgi:hypothetical protein